MLHVALFLAALLGQAQAAVAAAEPRVELGIYKYSADRARGGSASIGPDKTGFVSIQRICAVWARRAAMSFAG